MPNCPAAARRSAKGRATAGTEPRDRKSVGEGEQVAGAQGLARRRAGAAWLDSAGELRLAPDLAATLADCGLAVLVDYVVVACDVKGATRNAQLLGGRAPLGEVKGDRGDEAE